MEPIKSLHARFVCKQLLLLILFSHACARVACQIKSVANFEFFLTVIINKMMTLFIISSNAKYVYKIVIEIKIYIYYIYNLILQINLISQ